MNCKSKKCHYYNDLQRDIENKLNIEIVCQTCKRFYNDNFTEKYDEEIATENARHFVAEDN
jgi:hypothetical protein